MILTRFTISNNNIILSHTNTTQELYLPILVQCSKKPLLYFQEQMVRASLPRYALYSKAHASVQWQVPLRVISGSCSIVAGNVTCHCCHYLVECPWQVPLRSGRDLIQQYLTSKAVGFALKPIIFYVLHGTRVVSQRKPCTHSVVKIEICSHP